VLRFGVLLVAAASFAGIAPGLAQSLQSRGYYFNSIENAWEPRPAYEQPTPQDDNDFTKFLTLQEYRFNRAENTWEPLPAPVQFLSTSKQPD